MSEAATHKDQQSRPPLPPGWQYDFYREVAAYEKVRDQLVRDHLGKVVLIHKDEVIGVFDDPNDGIIAARTRFGDEHVMLREIRISDEPEYIASVDITHPSFWRID